MTGAILDVRDGRSTVYFGNEEARARRYAQKAEDAAGGIGDAVEQIDEARIEALGEISTASSEAQGAIAADRTAAETAAGVALGAPLDAERRGKVALANIFDPSRVTIGSGIRVSDGAVIAGIGSNYACSDFIRVDPSSAIATLNALNGPNATYGMALYTAAQAFVAGSGLAVLAAGTNTATASTAYFARFTVPISLLYSTHIVRGATAPTVFRGFEAQTRFNARGDFVDRVDEMFGVGKNLFDKDGVQDAAFLNSSGAVVTAGASAYYLSNRIVVTGGGSYVCNKGTPAGTFAIWEDANQTQIGAAFAIAAGTPITAPPAAAYLRKTGSNTSSDPRVGQSVQGKFSELVIEGTVLPLSYRAFGTVSPHGAEEQARKAARRQRSSKVNLFDPRPITATTLLRGDGTTTTSGASAYFVSGYVPVTPGAGLAVNNDFVPGNAQYGWNWVDRDLNRIGSSVATGVQANVTAGQFTLDVTNVGTTGPLGIGLPITATGVPANSWIDSVPATGPGTVGVYTFTNATGTPATASGTGVAVTGGGYLHNVMVMPPPGAAYGRVSGNMNAVNKLVITDETMTGALVQTGAVYSASDHIGVKDDIRRYPHMGRNFVVLGDSKTVDAGGNNAFCSTIEDWTRSNGIIWGGGSGRKWFQILDGGGGGTYGRGPTVPLVQADFANAGLLVISMMTNDFGIRNTSAGATTNPALVWPVKDSTPIGSAADTWVPTQFTATLTSGQTTLGSINVTRGALQAGLPIRGTGLDAACTLVDLGGGSWGLSHPATTNGSSGITGGTFYGDIKYNLVDRLMPWMAASSVASPTIAIIGADQRFDDILYHGQTGQAPGNPINARGHKLTDYVDALRNVANTYGLPFYDSHRNLGINVSNYPQNFSDGLHDILLCYEARKGPKLGRWLNSL